jgi:hypothetical protein
MEAKTTTNGKPLQLVKKDDKYFKENGKYFLGISKFGDGGSSITPIQQSGRDIQVLYEVYNNKFPAKWFSHVTDPLSAKDPMHKNFPAKVRPITILRTNIDLLQSEYPRRPFNYQLNNLSDDSYSTYQESLGEHMSTNMAKRFEQQVMMQLMEQGLLTEDGQPASEEALQQIQQTLEQSKPPEKLQEDYLASYKDAEAIKGQKYLKRSIAEHKIKQKIQRGFKHWLISGAVYSYKSIHFDKLEYRVFGELDIDYAKAEETILIEDGDWAVARRTRMVSDVVDDYYDVLKTKEYHELAADSGYLRSPEMFYSHLQSHADQGEVVEYHIVWKGKKKHGILTFMNEETGEYDTMEVDEDYPVDKEAGETVEWSIVNEVYETTRLGKDIWVNARAFPFQRNSLNNHSKCKLPYNGKRFSDMHSENISVLEIGIPIQIMYMIVTRTLELTIAKSKGKILMIDNNAIPRDNGWTEEKFFYYSEALGYGLLNRNQLGVDKSWNQYHAVDMTLFDSIRQLIELQAHYKQEWDDILGISRQRKGQTYASDGQGVNERAVFQSTVITDSIFNSFEDWVEAELQGFVDLSKFTAIDGLNQLWNSTDIGAELFEINPESYCTAELGVILESSSEAINLKNEIDQAMQAMLQNGVKPSTMLKLKRNQNIAEMIRTLEQIEKLEAEAAQAGQKGEAEAQEAADERTMRFEEYKTVLEIQKTDAEYDRKEDLEMIKGEFNTFTFQDGDSNDNGIPDAAEVAKHRLDNARLRLEAQQATQSRLDQIKKDSEDRKLKREEMASKERISKNKAKQKPTK